MARGCPSQEAGFKWENLGISDWHVKKLCITLRLTALFDFHKKISADADKAISRDDAGISQGLAESKCAIRTNETRGKASPPPNWKKKVELASPGLRNSGWETVNPSDAVAAKQQD